MSQAQQETAKSTTQLVKKLLSKIRKPDRLMEAYLTQVVSQGPTRFLAGNSPEIVAEFLSERFRFLSNPLTQTFATRVQNNAWELSGGGMVDAIEVVISDRPFLFDSIQQILFDRGVSIHVVLHPIIRIERDAKGSLKGLSTCENGGHCEVHMVFLVSPLSKSETKEIQKELDLVLNDVARCVDDFPAIFRSVNELIQQLHQSKETGSEHELLAWLAHKNFVFLGLLPFDYDGKKEGKNRWNPRFDEGLGLYHPERLKKKTGSSLVDMLTEHMHLCDSSKPFLEIEETEIISRVHRADPLTTVLVSPEPRDSRKGGVAIAGLFTHHAQRMDVSDIPMMGMGAQKALDELGLLRNTHRYKEVLDFVNGIPRLELFRISKDELSQMLGFFLRLTDEPAIEIEYFTNPKKKTFRVLISVPGGYVPPEAMRAIRHKLRDQLGLHERGTFVVRVSNLSIFGLLFPLKKGFVPPTKESDPFAKGILEELESRESQLFRLWQEQGKGEYDDLLVNRLVKGLPEDYKAIHNSQDTLPDLKGLLQLSIQGTRQFKLQERKGGNGWELALYDWELQSLSHIMPILTNLRVHVLREEAFEVGTGERSAFIQKFQLQYPGEPRLDGIELEEALRDLLFRAIDGELENDPLNALLFSCGFGWRQINLMMSLRNYLMQIGSTYTKHTINETLIRRWEATRSLFDLFTARFHPYIAQKSREAGQEKRLEELHDAMQDIDNLTEDRIYKRLSNLVLAGLRTNFYMDTSNPVISIKLASKQIDQLHTPHPMYEIWVHGPWMEGIHLRGGPIARGGIRYSDRPDDFRLEVLGLMDTQMKKNAMIVPVGSKGGFVVKNLRPYDGDPKAAGDAQYKVFIRSLLQITDNLVGGKCTPPKNVVRHEGDDPYLVVAADKGTAHLSDTANGISIEENFWLGDAFASGGSNGYDHKVVGITAKGAWESVKRHFWERGLNIARDSVRVVGIGDMSGDVFGNGMLLSPCLKVVGAFNHIHIFLDPDPDPHISFEERQRLFKLPRSSWTDYNTKKISQGGGVFSRQAKSIALNPKLQALLDTEEKEMSGESVIQALLAADVDLIWNGGIGTYIKSERETHAQVGDHSNDAVRIDVPQCRAKVIGEGGNLGLSQQARMDLDRQGTILNTDAIDNAGGVHMSDQEVNLKILLNMLLESGKMANVAARNKQLASMTGEVTERVLHHNYLQTVAISMALATSRLDVSPFLGLIDVLAAGGMLDRRGEFVPPPQQFQQFQSSGSGIPRPLLSVLLSRAKMALFDKLQSSTFLDHPFLAQFFVNYFPASLGKKYKLADLQHPLRRQIIATVLTNRVVDQAGMVFVYQLASVTGKDWADVVQAYLIADILCDAGTLRNHIYSLDNKMPAAMQYEILQMQEDVLADMVKSMLLQDKVDLVNVKDITKLQTALGQYEKVLATIEQKKISQEVTEKIASWQSVGMDAEIALKAARLPALREFFNAAQIETKWKLGYNKILPMVELFEQRALTRELSLAIAQAPVSSSWRKDFADNLQRTLHRHKERHLTQLIQKRGKGTPEEWVASYFAKNAVGWDRYQSDFRRVVSEKQPDLVALAVVVGILGEL